MFWASNNNLDDYLYSGELTKSKIFPCAVQGLLGTRDQGRGSFKHGLDGSYCYLVMSNLCIAIHDMGGGFLR